MLIAEAVKHKNSIREVEMKSNLQNYNFQEDEAFQGKRCDKLYVSKEFFLSHIKTMHQSLKYDDKDIFKCRIWKKKKTVKKSS